MTLTIELTDREAARLRALATARGTDAATTLRNLLADQTETEPGITWGEQVLAQWQKEGLIGPFGDPDKDSTEVARDLRRSLEQDLFRPSQPAKGER